MSARNRFLIFPIPTIFIFLLFFTFENSSGHRTTPTPSCGNFTNIRFPSELKAGPRSCGDEPSFQLDCMNSQTPTLNIRYDNPTEDLGRYVVQRINYEEYKIRLVDPGINNEDLSSCPINDPWNLYAFGTLWSDRPENVPVAFIHCLFSVNSTKYVKGSFCGNTSNIFGNSSEFYSYIMVGDPGLLVSDLEESCTVDKLGWISTQWRMMDKSSLMSIYDGLSYGFEVSWYIGSCHLVREALQVECCLGEPSPLETIALEAALAGGVILAIRQGIIIIGIPYLIWLGVRRWQRRHLSADETIEKFLQDEHHLVPIKFKYSDIKNMTNNFNRILGEGGYGTVYKGKLLTGVYVAIKMMDQSIASEEDFINEVGTIGRIHHVNVVQLIGFCVERSKYALVYEFLPNGSLDRYIFNQWSLEITTLTFKKMFKIAVGVAHGIEYLHHGCDMQILHFDIKPHNILLDEKFNPKISDFGLARLHPTNESFINITAARGTMGYMAPEMYYRNIGGISYKADVYSFGMMLMEMAGRRKNMDYLAEGTNQIYFPLWVYDQLCMGNDIVITDATEEERKMVKRIIIVALWCMQTKPSTRPSMSKVVEMLESEFEPPMPLKPFVALHGTTIIDDHEITQTYSVDYINLNIGEN